MKTILFLICLFSLSAWSQKKFNIQTRVKTGKHHEVQYLKVKNPELIDKVFDSSFILNSKISFHFQGILEGNICEYRYPVLIVSENKQRKLYELKLYPIQKFNAAKKQSIPVTDPACTSHSEPTPFKFSIEVAPSIWWAEKKQEIWKYLITDSKGNEYLLQIKLHERDGWSWKTTARKK